VWYLNSHFKLLDSWFNDDENAFAWIFFGRLMADIKHIHHHDICPQQILETLCHLPAAVILLSKE
jgi:hypothetical protein